MPMTRTVLLGCFFFVLRIILLAVASSGTMILRKVPQPLVVRLGDNATMDCVGQSSHSDVRYSCSWLKDGAAVFVGDGLRKRFYDYVDDERALSGDCSVQLRNVDVGTHHGRWTCTVVNTNTWDEMPVSHQSSITVLAAPTYPEVQDTRGNTVTNVTAIEGRIKQLHCLSRGGNPAATLGWWLDTVDVSSNATYYNNSEPSTALAGMPAARVYTAGSWLPLLVNRSLDGSVLRCVARHQAYDDDEVPVVQLRLDVVYPPVNLSGDPNVTTTRLNDALPLECPLNGKPEPNYTWYWIGSGGQKMLPIGYERILYVDRIDDTNLSADLPNDAGGGGDGGYMCSASNLMDREHHTAFSGMFVIVPTAAAYDPRFCRRDDIAFSVAVILGSCALLSLAIEVTLLLLFRKRPNRVVRGSTDRSSAHNTFYELYRTRGHKMTLVNVRSEQDSKREKGFSWRMTSSLVSIVMVFVDIITIGACSVAIYFCFYADSCDCKFDHPAILVTMAFGSAVIICQVMFFTTFCIRKNKDSKSKNYLRNKEKSIGSATNPTSEQKSRPASKLSLKEEKPAEINDNEENNGGEVPGSVPD